MNVIKKLRKIILFIPIVIVLIMFVVALIVNVNGKEYKFKIEQYDPVDMFRGRYLNLSIPMENVFFEELLGVNIVNDDGEFEDEDRSDFDLMQSILKLNKDDFKFLEATFKNIYMTDLIHKFEEYEMDYEDEEDDAEVDIDTTGEDIYDMTDESILEILESINLDKKINSDDFRALYEFYLDSLISNMSFSEILLNAVENYRYVEALTYDEFFKACDEYESDGVYVTLTETSNGYAKIDKVSKEKISDDTCIKVNLNKMTYGNSFFTKFRVNFNISRYYVDEKYATLYERYVNRCMRLGKEVYIKVKVLGNNINVTDLVVDGESLEEISISKMEKELD